MKIFMLTNLIAFGLAVSTMGYTQDQPNPESQEAQELLRTLMEKQANLTPTPKQAEQLPKNLALIYWQAFALLPELSEEEEKALNTFKVSDDYETEDGRKRAQALKQVIKRTKPTMDLLRLTSYVTGAHCDWGLLHFQGPDMVLVHLSKLKYCARLAQLHTTFAASSDEAVASMKVMLQLSNHCATDAIIGSLVSKKIRTMYIDYLNTNPKLLSNADRVELIRHLKTVDAIGDLRKAVFAELKVFTSPYQEKVNSLLQEDQPEQTQKALKVLAEYLNGYGKHVNAVAEALLLSPEKAKATIAKLDEQVQTSDNPYLKNGIAYGRIVTPFYEMQSTINSLK